MSNIPATAQHRPLTVPTGPLGFLSMTVGLKLVMAVSGVVLVGFVVAHFIGNALIWVGPEAINAYSHALHAAPELLWVARIVLIVAVIAHIGAALKLAAKNTAARPQRYKKKRDHVTNYAARTMIWSGPILLGFILFHLAHLTLGVAPGTYEHSTTDVYSNVVRGFSIPWVTGLYVVSMLALGNHLFHGTWSMFQSLGLNHATYNHKLMRLALGLTVFVTLGDIAIPLSVLFGLVS
ncbi:MAG TPA: succinate dehydrogenase cytochrome b subunit [Polyangiales bacterium]|jgi:succinate dehydrogenase / fumarate reductase cytochrome b subunit|nr:succinate dehydrogenase cytochrome b subunit [Polyangiales bacterium]